MLLIGGCEFSKENNPIALVEKLTIQNKKLNVVPHSHKLNIPVRSPTCNIFS